MALKSFLCFLLLNGLISYVAAQYNCTMNQVVNPPANISNPWFYPSSWTDKLEAPAYAASQNCSWIINVPKGMFAYFALKADTNQAPTLTLIDSIGYSTTIEKASMDPYFLMSPQFRVQLQADNNNQIGTLGMRVQWYNIQTPYPTTWSVSPNGSPLALFSGDFDNGTVIQAQSQVSLVSIPPNNLVGEFTSYMRLTQVFDGPSMNSTFIGNLYQIMANAKNFVSSGNSLFIYSLLPGFVINNIVVLQDYNDVKQFKSYKGVQCFMPTLCQLSLDASAGTAAAIRYTGSTPFYVKQMAMPETSVLSVYTDSPIETHRLADYTSTTAKTNIPQKFSGAFTTFVLNHGQATAQLSSQSNDANWGVGFDGRRGFFSSPNYGINTAAQNFKDQVIAPRRSNITYTVDRASMVGNATLHVTIFDSDKTVLEHLYSPKDFPGGPVSSLGNNIYVEYNSYEYNSTGAFVNFAFDHADSSGAKYGVFGALVVALWMGISF